MLLALDIGNSSIDIGVFDGGGDLIATSKMSAVKTKCTDEYAVILDGILRLNGITPSSIDGCIISSVVPPLTRAVSGSALKLFGKPPLEIGPGVKTGLNIRVDNQSELGSDLVANAVAASHMFNAPCVIIDMGTTTTFTVLGGENTLEGVIIAPGVRLSLDALASFTSNLTDVSISMPKRMVGKNTRDSMNSGVLYGHAFMVDGFISEIKNSLGASHISAAATGGLAGLVLPCCKSEIEHVPFLTLLGLRLIYEKNMK